MRIARTAGLRDCDRGGGRCCREAPRNRPLNDLEISRHNRVLRPRRLVRAPSRCAEPIAVGTIRREALERASEVDGIVEQFAATGMPDDFRERSDAPRNDRRALAKCFARLPEQVVRIEAR